MLYFLLFVQVNMWSLGQPGTTGQQIGVHDAAVKTIRFIPELNLVASASWSVKELSPYLRNASGRDESFLVAKRSVEHRNFNKQRGV